MKKNRRVKKMSESIKNRYEFVILFDVETGFLWPWATVLDEGGWVVFWPMILFLAVLALADAYLWKKGAFDWE